MAEEMQYETLMEALHIRIVTLEKEKVVAEMPVDGRVKQPFGLLHGGASVALAETAASVGAYHLVDQEKQFVVGLEINANHIRSKKDGMVTAVGVPLHVGRSTMVWEVKLTDEENKLLCVSRCTIAVRSIQ